MTQKCYLFYIAHNYSFEILRPIQEVILSQGDQVKWLAIGKEVTLEYFLPMEIVLDSIADAIAYQPDATFAPGNEIPNFIPGLKVQVFHGLEWKKKGHFGIRGFFDLYCTHGPATTLKFQKLAERYGYFDVIETGWSKLDYLFKPTKSTAIHSDKKTILYAPTFSPALTSAPDLYQEIARLSVQNNYHWLIKFHPKMPIQWVNTYKKLANKQLIFIENSSITEQLQIADIMLSDTSSVIGEFSLLNKPTISYNNKDPGNYLINIQQPEQLEEAITLASNLSLKLSTSIKKYADDLHPYADGKSSLRILKAVENILMYGKKSKRSKPYNLFRNFQQRKKLNFWQF